MKRPAFQFYPQDWIGNQNLRRCSRQARSVWIDTLCALHDSDEYGIVRYPLRELADVVHSPIKLLLELADKKVLKGSDGACPAFIYVPRHAGKDGNPVVLIPENPGPCWYSSRMVKDEYVRANAGASTRFKADPGPDKEDPGATPTQRQGVPPGLEPTQRQGVRQGAGSSTSSSTSKNKTIPPHTPPPGGIVSGFDAFWSAYPKKVGKAKAADAWFKLKPDAGLVDTLMRALAAAKDCNDWRKEEGRYIPHPATWLNGRRWEDDLSARSTAPHQPGMRVL